MKRILLLLLLISGMTEAQIVNIPDANFKAKLLQANSTNTIAYTGSGYGKIDTNNDGEIQVNEALAIRGLDVPNSNISDLTGIENFTNLSSLFCPFNQITTLDVSAIDNLLGLYCNDNNLVSINLGTNKVDYLYCQNNQLTSIDVANNLFLSVVDCSMNNISSLDFTNSIFVGEIRCSNNPITNLDLSQFINLQILHCANTLLTTLDCSTSTQLLSLYIHGNSLLETLNIKNGSDESAELDSGSWLENWNNLPSLQYVCADENQVASIQNLLPVGSAMVGSYCSFTPGGNYNTITGKTIFDSNNNGCDALDLAQSFLKLKINDGTNQGASFTDTTGTYTFYTQAGNFTITPEVENPTFFNINPINAIVNFPLVNNSTSTNNFCITANGIHPDAEIVIAPVTPARPGFDAVYKIVYKNRGNQVLSGNVYFYYDEALLDYLTSTAVPTQSNGLLTFAFSNLMPFESKSISVTLNVNSPTETPAVNSGDELIFNAATDPIGGNEITFSYFQTVVGSYDPNDITCLEGDVVPPSEIGEYLHYMIRFENTGNFAAENIVVKDILDPAKYDISSLQILDSSHPLNADVKGNTAEFVFRNINLDSGGHGNILIKLRSLSSLGSGSMVSNGVGIYFDYNFPVNTDNANTVFQALSIGEKYLDSSVKVYPNPADDFVNIKASSPINSIEIYDVQGRILMTGLYSKTSATLDLSRQSSGIYYLKIKTKDGSKVEKVIKK